MALPVQLQNGEEALQIVKRHPMSLIGRFILIGLVVIVVGAMWVAWGLGGTGNFATVMNWTMGIVLLVGLALAGIYYYRYQNDLWIITNQRVIDSTKTTPFNHSVKTADLVNLQDISTDKHGVWQTMFDYGDVQCQTASAQGHQFVFRGVRNPAQVLDEIDQARDAARASRSAA